MDTKLDLQTLIVRKLEGIITPEELSAFEAMIAASPEAADEYMVLEKVWKASQQLGKLQGDTADMRWARLQSRINTQTLNETKPRTMWLRYAAVGAFFLAIALTYFIIRDDSVIVTTSANETKYITLPDSSIVTISGNSKLSYDVSVWNSDRNVQLQGEAFFDVRQNGNSFIVESLNTRIAVLGTSFNVNASGQQTIVTCFTGKVSVASTLSDQQVVLTRGLEAVVKRDLVTQPYQGEAFDLVGDLNFNNTPLKVVFKSLAHYHQRQIATLVDIDTVSFTGNLKETSLESALTTICLSAGLEFTPAGDSIIIEYRK